MVEGESKPPESLAERFWSLARGMEGATDSTEPVDVVEHVLGVLDSLEAGKLGRDLSASTMNFLTLLRQHEVKGDLLYASPEQARGEQVDERSLVFSVGVLLFEKLTGRHPFGAEGSPQRLARIRRGEMGSGVNYFPRVPAELRVVLLKAMGPFPEERWSSLAELRAHLSAFVGLVRDPDRRGVPMQTRPLPALPGPPAEPPSRRVPEPQADLMRMVSMSGSFAVIHDETTPAAPALSPSRPRRRLPPGAWAFGGVVLGVLTTSTVFLAAWPDRHRAVAPASAGGTLAEPAQTRPPIEAPMPASTSDESAPPAASPSPTRAAAATSAAAAKSPDTASSARTRAATTTTTAATAPAATATSSTSRGQADSPSSSSKSNASAAPSKATPGTPPRTPASPQAGEFDPTAGGRAALAAVRTCVVGDRSLQFGASLLYDVRSGLSRRIFFGGVEQLSRPERTCLENALMGLSAGAAPQRGTLVTYTFRISPTGDLVKAHLHPPP
ncbi:MAG TPA: hypothetical protein VKB80_30535 [Kofleriaceae bacterium]|nr:hypothetical protein [Kofleriaceae bacterium]